MEAPWSGGPFSWALLSGALDMFDALQVPQMGKAGFCLSVLGLAGPQVSFLVQVYWGIPCVSTGHCLKIGMTFPQNTGWICIPRRRWVAVS